MMILSAPTCVAIALVFAGLILLLHHEEKHKDDDEESLAKREGVRACCYFQPRDVANHETWVVVCWTNALSVWVMGQLLSSD